MKKSEVNSDAVDIPMEKNKKVPEIDYLLIFLHNATKAGYSLQKLGEACLIVGNEVLDDSFTDMILDNYLSKKDKEITRKC